MTGFEAVVLVLATGVVLGVIRALAVIPAAAMQREAERRSPEPPGSGSIGFWQIYSR